MPSTLHLLLGFLVVWTTLAFSSPKGGPNLVRLQWRIDNLQPATVREMLKLQQLSPDGVLPVLKVRLRRSLVDGKGMDGEDYQPEHRLDWLEGRIAEIEDEAYKSIKDLGL